MAGFATTREAEVLLAEHGLLKQPAKESVSVLGLSNNSKETKPGDLFICKGFSFKKEYLEMAEQKGAFSAIGEQEIAGSRLPFILVTDIRKAMSLLAKAFYEEPSAHFCLVGITGTKGKTTTAYDLKAIFDAHVGRETGLLSTVERFVGGLHEPSHLTTPESLDLQQLFCVANSHKLPYLTMEVSSQAYKLDRVYGQKFQYGLFLNFGEDHICDHEHSDLEDYFSCKLQLMKNCETAVVCKETDRLEEICSVASRWAKKVLLVGVEDETCDYSASQLQKEQMGFSFLIHEKKSGLIWPCRLSQEGRFNVSNALAAIAVAREEGISPETIQKALENLQVPGRMNLIAGKDLHIFVDYAHNDLSFRALFDSICQDYPEAKRIVVAGAPGERAHSRRKDIGSLCGKYADLAIFTADDPGFEDPLIICKQMEAFAKEAGEAEIRIETDRTKAVEMAVREAPAGSVVILAGKGHEVTQRVRGTYEPYESDAAVARRVLEETGRCGK